MSYRVNSRLTPGHFEILADAINAEHGVLIVKTELPSDFPQILVTLANGLEVSIVSHEFSYGGESRLFEAAIKREFDYDEPEGWLNRAGVLEFIRKALDEKITPEPPRSTVPENMVTWSV